MTDLTLPQALQTRRTIAFWALLVISNAYAAGDKLWLAAIWLGVAVACLIGGAVMDYRAANRDTL